MQILGGACVWCRINKGNTAAACGCGAFLRHLVARTILSCSVCITIGCKYSNMFVSIIPGTFRTWGKTEEQGTKSWGAESRVLFPRDPRLLSREEAMRA